MCDARFHSCTPRDSVDALLESWHERRPDLDFSPVGVISRLVSQRRLMEELGLTSGTMSVRIDRLEAAGLVNRRPDPRSVADFYAAIDDAARGGRLPLRIVRGTEEQRMTVTLGEAARLDGASACTAGRSAMGEHRL